MMAKIRSERKRRWYLYFFILVSVAMLSFVLNVAIKSDTASATDMIFYMINDFSGTRPPYFRDYGYGPVIFQNGLCIVEGKTAQRCGAALSNRDQNTGQPTRDGILNKALMVDEFNGIRLVIRNMADETFRNFTVNGYFNWYEKVGNGYGSSAYAPVRIFPIVVNELPALGTREIFIPWKDMLIQDGYEFHPESGDLFSGIAFGNAKSLEDPSKKISLGIDEIALYGNSGAAIKFLEETHTGGYLVLQKSNGARYTLPGFNSGGTWGEPFAGFKNQYGDDMNLGSGDTIEVHGVVPCGAVIRASGTQEQPITIKGVAADGEGQATLDGAKARELCQLGREGDLLTLEGNDFVVKDLLLRSTGANYGWSMNATAINLTNSKRVMINNVEIYDTGMGIRSSYDSEDIRLYNSRIVGAGYPGGDGQYHNLYLLGRNHAVDNIYSGYSSSQNLKVRACNTTVQNSVFDNGLNFQIDYPDHTDNPDSCQHVFSGNTVIVNTVQVNPSQIFTFFADGTVTQHPATLYATNNTFIDPSAGVLNQAKLFRCGSLKVCYLYNNVLEFQNLEYRGGSEPSREGGLILGSRNFLLSNSNGAPQLIQSVRGADPLLQGDTERYFPLESSPLVDAGLSSAPYVPVRQYHQPHHELLPGEIRPTDGMIDIGAFEFTAFQDEPPQCVENWECTEWSVCENGIQRRTCTDLNACGTEENKPAEEQTCEQVLCKGSATIANGATEPEMNRVSQSRLNARYSDFGYSGIDNQVNSSNFYNVMFHGISEALPDRAKITKGELVLRFYRQSLEETLVAYPLLEEWAAEESGHASMTLRQGAYDAYNRKNANLPAVRWQTVGGTIGNPVIEQPVVNTENQYNIERHFDITDLAKSWSTAASPNYGLQIRSRGTNGFNDIFGARKVNNGENLGPKLLLEYEYPCH